MSQPTLMHPKDSRRDHWTIMETLTAYIREHAPWPPRQAVANPFVELQSNAAGESRPAEKPEHEAERTSSQVRPATDTQAILTILGRRDEKARKQDEAAKRRLELTETDLRGADLLGAHLEGADLLGAHLEAPCSGEPTWKRRAQGSPPGSAVLRGAHLEGAVLREAHLEGAVLREAHLEGADLLGAHLEGAVLLEAHLEGADYLTQEQLDSAHGNNHTVLPEGLKRPAHWSKTTLNEQADEPRNRRQHP